MDTVHERLIKKRSGKEPRMKKMTEYDVQTGKFKKDSSEGQPLLMMVQHQKNKQKKKREHINKAKIKQPVSDGKEFSFPT
jgi:hypothetical protein